MSTKFGDEPWGLAHLTNHTGTIAVLGAIVTMVASSFSPFLMLAVILATVNDFRYAARETAAKALSPSDSGLPLPPANNERNSYYEPVIEHVTEPQYVNHRTSSDVQPMTEPEPEQVAHIRKAAIHSYSAPVQPSGIIQRMAEQPQSMLLIGSPGSGKGVVVSNLVRELSYRHPELKVIGIDPKGDDKETGYWEEGFDEVFRCNHLQMTNVEYAQWFNEKIDRLRSETGNVLYVIDEMTASFNKLAAADKAAFNNLVSLLFGIASSGPSRRIYVILVGQVPHAATMNLSGGARSAFAPVAIVNGDRFDMAQQFLKTSFVPSPGGGADEMRQLLAASPVNRAIYYQGWQPLERLENHSGFDRDTHQPIHPIQPVQTESANKRIADELIAQVRAWGKGMIITPSTLAQSTWATNWSAGRGDRPRLLRDRRSETLIPFLERLQECGALQKRQDKEWVVSIS